MLANLKEIIINNKKFLPILEGGKGIGVSTGITAGNFALNGAIGTFSGVNPDIINSNGEIVRMIIKAKNRLERHIEMIQKSISGIISQAKRARDICLDKGRIHMNVLWEMGGTEYILEEALSKVKGLIQGVVCGAGLPYKLGDICAKHKVNYFPIVSSARAFRILWKKSYQRTKEWLGGVVYECPWRAGGHNGLSNSEDPFIKGSTYDRVKELRKLLDDVGLKTLPIVVAGGVWNIKEYEHFLNNEEIGNVAFQFGTRPMLTKESPISDHWKQTLLNLDANDVKTNRFSPTGFWSSAINNELLKELFDRSTRQLSFSNEKTDVFDYLLNTNNLNVFIKGEDKIKVDNWLNNNYSKIVKTPDDTLLFITDDKFKELQQDVCECCGCLSQCQFSCWCQNDDSNNHNTGHRMDFRKFCIQKALQNAKNDENIKKQLYFAGSEAYRFKTDPMYKNGFIPSIKELINALINGK